MKLWKTRFALDFGGDPSFSGAPSIKTTFPKSGKLTASNLLYPRTRLSGSLIIWMALDIHSLVGTIDSIWQPPSSVLLQRLTVASRKSQVSMVGAAIAKFDGAKFGKVKTFQKRALSKATKGCCSHIEQIEPFSDTWTQSVLLSANDSKNYFWIKSLLEDCASTS